MRSAKKREYYFRSILLIITSCACISIVVFNFVQFRGGENLETEVLKENSYLAEKLSDEKCVPVCFSRSCIKQAEMLLSTLNSSNDPCENFQNFLCGSFEEKISRYENKSLMFDMTIKMRYNLKNIIENIEAESRSAAGKMKIVYDSCVSLGSSEVRGVDAFRQILDDVEIFNWPHLPADFRFSDTGLSKLLGTFNAYGDVRMFAFAIESEEYEVHIPHNEEYEEYEDLDEKVIKVLSRTNTFNDTPVIPKDIAADILKYFAIESEEIEILWNDYDSVKSALINFDEEFEVYSYTCNEDCFDRRINCSNAENNEWAYVCEVVQTFLNVTKLEGYVNKNEIVIDKYNIHYIKNFIPRLKLLSDRSTANFFALRMLWRNLDKLNFFFRRKMQKYLDYFKIDKKSEMPISNKWEYCVMWITENMKIVLVNELVKSYLSRTYMDELHDFHQSFTAAVSETIDHQEWISLAAKEMLKNHINDLDCSMVLIKQLLPNDTYVNKYYETFKPTSASFFRNVKENMASITHVYTRFEFNHEGILKSQFIAGAHTDLQSIVIHYGLFMPPIFYPDHEKFVKLILIAPIIVHEIGHNINSLLDMIGKYSNTTKDAFLAKKQCLENQFSKFKFRSLNENLNGTQYLEENLSDNLGFTIADKMIEDFSEDGFLLPGLPYSLKQLLYMSNRQVFCAKYSREMELNLKTTDQHTPQEYRIIGSAQNSKGYSKAFSCPEGNFMNPIEKCTFFYTD